MRATVTLDDIARNLPEYVDRVSESGRPLIITRDGVAIAELRPVRPEMTLSQLADLLALLPRLSEEEAAAFERDIDTARDELRCTPP